MIHEVVSINALEADVNARCSRARNIDVDRGAPFSFVVAGGTPIIVREGAEIISATSLRCVCGAISTRAHSASRSRLPFRR